MTTPGNRLRDITGQRFGRLVVMSRGPSDCRREVQWHCRCDCGADHLARGSQLRRGLISSCGCLKAEVQRELNTVHGQVGTATYRAWTSMLARVRNPRSAGWATTGGRGIRVHEPWLDFAAFFSDLGPRPGPGYCLTRLDRDDHFAPGNLAWQQRTRTRARSRATRG